jgi:hypothetical protein
MRFFRGSSQAEVSQLLLRHAALNRQNESLRAKHFEYEGAMREASVAFTREREEARLEISSLRRRLAASGGHGGHGGHRPMAMGGPGQGR